MLDLLGALLPLAPPLLRLQLQHKLHPGQLGARCYLVVTQEVEVRQINQERGGAQRQAKRLAEAEAPVEVALELPWGADHLEEAADLCDTAELETGEAGDQPEEAGLLPGGSPQVRLRPLGRRGGQLPGLLGQLQGPNQLQAGPNIAVLPRPALHPLAGPLLDLGGEEPDLRLQEVPIWGVVADGGVPYQTGDQGACGGHLAPGEQQLGQHQTNLGEEVIR